MLGFAGAMVVVVVDMMGPVSVRGSTIYKENWRREEWSGDE
jgi:hypothetical protein